MAERITSGVIPPEIMQEIIGPGGTYSVELDSDHNIPHRFSTGLAPVLIEIRGGKVTFAISTQIGEHETHHLQDGDFLLLPPEVDFSYVVIDPEVCILSKSPENHSDL